MAGRAKLLLSRLCERERAGVVWRSLPVRQRVAGAGPTGSPFASTYAFQAPREVLRVRQKLMTARLFASLVESRSEGESLRQFLQNLCECRQAIHQDGQSRHVLVDEPGCSGEAQIRDVPAGRKKSPMPYQDTKELGVNANHATQGRWELLAQLRHIEILFGLPEFE